ncbi:hypothetical protein PI125_g17921 [Phytophthora idaei]|nr:hypothetical protein PI125_g17921 [Phytophthora idaei]
MQASGQVSVVALHAPGVAWAAYHFMVSTLTSVTVIHSPVASVIW